MKNNKSNIIIIVVVIIVLAVVICSIFITNNKKTINKNKVENKPQRVVPATLTIEERELYPYKLKEFSITSSVIDKKTYYYIQLNCENMLDEVLEERKIKINLLRDDGSVIYSFDSNIEHVHGKETTSVMKVTSKDLFGVVNYSAELK